jgi:hypothetical protein
MQSNCRISAGRCRWENIVEEEVELRNDADRSSALALIGMTASMPIWYELPT